MKILLSYLKNYKSLIIWALLLATINQIFSLLDPYIFGKIIDRFGNNPQNYSEPEFIKGVLMLILAAMGVAMVSRIAKAFQDYVTNLIVQKFGAAVYSDGLKHSLRLPYQEFEDQRSGETLNVLQKVRSDSEKFITAFINVFFFAIVGIVFVMIYAIYTYWPLVFIYFVASFILGYITNYLSKKIKSIQKKYCERNQYFGRSYYREPSKYRTDKKLGPHPPRGAQAQHQHHKNIAAGTQKSA